MKKAALALLVLAIAMPAMADVNITLSNDANIVTIGYECDAGEVVRAFALNIDVNNGGFVVGSVVPNTDDYWVYPTNMTFTIVDGNTVVDEYGSPIAGETNDGGVLEMASLYGENDPCRQDAPRTSGTLCSFAINLVDYCPGNVTVYLSLNAQRGGIVLEDPDAAVNVNLPADLVIPASCKCPAVGAYCGGVMISQTMYDNWVLMGEPNAWCYPSHFAGDSNLDCAIDAIDVVGPALPNMKAAFGKVWPDPGYAPSCDTDNNLGIDAIDVVGGGTTDCLPNGCGCKPNFGRVFYDPIYCP